MCFILPILQVKAAMDQTAIFKWYYMRTLIDQVMTATDKEGWSTVRDFWKMYNIWNAVNIIRD